MRGILWFWTRHATGREDMTHTPLATLIQHLQFAECYSHATSSFEVFETHISYVILTGDYVYKFKKPVDLGFLDFSTLEKRKFYCGEELRLNRRLAPAMYLDVVSVHGTPEHPVVGGEGPLLEYAVKMRQFATADRMDNVTARGELTAEQIDQLAYIVAAFHEVIPIAASDSPFGTLETIQQRIMQNFEQVLQNTDEPEISSICLQLRDWSGTALEKRQDLIAQRKQEGAVRECHGDMHMANIVMLEGKPVIYDCLEFAEDLRWIDTVSEVAFLYMDLDFHHQHKLALRFLNQYMSRCGDYAGLGLFCIYLVYRAMVRAKVNSIEAKQQASNPEIAADSLATTKSYLALARNYIESFASPVLIILHGLSGSGKSWLAERLLESYGAVQIRSDVERKRLLGLEAQAKTKSAIGQGAYSANMTTQTYQRLLDLASIILQAGPSVIVDATFLKKSQREQFQQLAQSLDVPYVILDLQASEDTLKSRIIKRAGEAKDASEATLKVLQQQITTDEAISASEAGYTIQLDMEKELDMDVLVQQIKQHKR
jgi:aminoglycoside phosphotransferase family enzyme/predicted kinase